MKKVRGLIVAILCMVISVTGCQNTEKQQEQTVDLQQLEKDMLAADTTLPKMDICSSEDSDAELNFLMLSEESYDMVEEYFYAYAADGSAQEIAVVRVKDPADVAVMMSSLSDHIDTRTGTMREYAPEQATLTEQAVLTREGSYITLIISEKNGLVQQAFEEAFD